MKNQTQEIIALSDKEIDSVTGAFAPLVAVAVAKLYGAAFAGGYFIGRMEKADREN